MGVVRPKNVFELTLAVALRFCVSFAAMLTPEPTTVIPPKSERTEEHERLLRDSRREANWKRWGA